MSIRHRRGLYDQFDKTKLLPAEMAIVTGGDPIAVDGKAAYIAMGAGTVKKLATHEDMVHEVKNQMEKSGEEVAGEIADELARQVKEAAENANSKAQYAQEQGNAAKTAISSANMATSNAKDAAQYAREQGDAAKLAASSASTAATEAREEAGNARTAAFNALSAAQTADGASAGVEEMKNYAKEQGDAAKLAASSANAAAGNADEKAQYAREQGEAAQTGAQRANEAAEKAEALVLGDISEKTVTFQMAAERAGILSGDSLATALGKLSRFCEDFQPHTFVPPVNNLLGTDPSLSLAAPMGAELKRINDDLSASFNTLNDNLAVKRYSDSYEPNGITVFATVQGVIACVKLRGSTLGNLGTSSGYAVLGTIPELGALLTTDNVVISRELLTKKIFGQLRIDQNGQVKIGFTFDSEGKSINISAGTDFYLEKTFVMR